MNLFTLPDRNDREGQAALREAKAGNSERENLLNELAWARRRLRVEAELGIPPMYTETQLANLLNHAETYIAVN